MGSYLYQGTRVKVNKTDKGGIWTQLAYFTFCTSNYETTCTKTTFSDQVQILTDVIDIHFLWMLLVKSGIHLYIITNMPQQPRKAKVNDHSPITILPTWAVVTKKPNTCKNVWGLFCEQIALNVFKWHYQIY